MLILLEVETHAFQGEASSSIKFCQLPGSVLFRSYGVSSRKDGFVSYNTSHEADGHNWPFSEVSLVDFVQSWCIHSRQPSSLLKREEDTTL
jgi:hypothetical protein